MMNPFMSLHAMASPRGDGLRPELLRLLEARHAFSNSGVIELHPRRRVGRDQAGPNPVGQVDAPTKEVLLFPNKTVANGRETKKGKLR